MKVVFTVNVYNEGVDIPCVNTVLFLRPTQSLTVFLQQLGRGLRHDDVTDKECLTVLDYVGQAHAKYSYEERFRALLNHSNHSVEKSVSSENYSLPRGCHIKMESGLEFRLGTFLSYYDMSVKEFYGTLGNRSFYSLSREIQGKDLSGDYNMGLVRDDERHCKEIVDILSYQYERIGHAPVVQELNVASALDVHGSYTTSQILAGLGYYNDEKMPAFREGALHLKDGKTDVFFITLNKSEKEFSEATRYEDYPLNEVLFHWQSQNKVSRGSATEKRYVEHDGNGHDILLFVREMKKMDGFVSPYVFLGKGHYVRHEGSKPVSFVWRLEKEMPGWFLEYLWLENLLCSITRLIDVLTKMNNYVSIPQ